MEIDQFRVIHSFIEDIKGKGGMSAFYIPTNLGSGGITY